MSTTSTEASNTPTYEKGSWQAALANSAKVATQSDEKKKQAGSMLWRGARAAISEFIGTEDEPGTYLDDESGEALYEEVKEALGGDARRGDASKVRTVALAVLNHDLDLDELGSNPNKMSLSKAYAAARKLMTDDDADAAANVDDAAAEQVTEALAESAPKTASTPESAASILLSRGIDEAVRILLDTLNGPSGENNESAHRAFVRAAAAEASGRMTAIKQAAADAAAAKRQAERDAKAEERAKAKAERDAERAAAAEAKAEERAAAKKASPAKKAAVKKAVPVSKSKGDANARPLPPKASDPADDSDFFDGDGDDDIDEADVKPTPVKKAAPVKKAVPVKRV